MMNILVDGRTFCRYAAGITSVLRNALNEWTRQQPHDMFYLLLPKRMDNKIDASAFADNVRLLQYDNPLTRKLPNIIIMQFIVPKLCRQLNIDLYFTPVPHLPFFMPRRMRKLVMVHDVVNIEFQQTMSLTNRMANKFFFGYAVNNADLLWYNSHYTEQKIAQYFPDRKSRNGIVGISSDDSIYNNVALPNDIIDALKDKYHFLDKYILFVGSLEPRKNLSFLISLAPRIYKESGLQLVVVGANKWKSSELSEVVNSEGFLRESVVFLGYVSDVELAALYHNARCLVSTSLNEGFGLPQLEALKCGCPIVTANNSAMAEVAHGKDGAVTVDGYNPDVWIEAISRTALNRPKVNSEQLSQYNWQHIISTLTTNL